jgi:hypothetical protein
MWHKRKLENIRERLVGEIWGLVIVVYKRPAQYEILEKVD